MYILHFTGAILLPKLRNYFAEFLNQSYLARLGILYLSTCVGLRYGHHAYSLESFLGGMGVRWLRLWRLGIVPLASWDPDFPGSRPTHLPRGNQRPGPPTLPRHPIADLPLLGRSAPKGSP